MHPRFKMTRDEAGEHRHLIGRDIESAMDHDAQ